MKILLLEDDTETANCLLQGLQEAGHQCPIEADWPHQGLSRSSAQDWDLLIVDRTLPRLEGLGTVRTLRATGHNARAGSVLA